ncbi:DUF1343 domain-containing protein [bacterium]|nr:DUF1343 domain-containing protein [bacterium]
MAVSRMAKRMQLCSVLVLVLFALAACFGQNQSKVRVGIDNLIQNPPKVMIGKRLGLITNPTGITSNLESTIDVLVEDGRFELTALFGPEHGVRGDIIAGKRVQSYTDPVTNLPVHSLYGATRKPTAEMLEEIDVLLFDIQDIGIRPYTYIYTMALAIQAAKEQSIPFVVLDRPNPLGGLMVAGPVLEAAFKSFIGLYPIPYIHGMTAGELARLFNTEFDIGCDLTVIPLGGWRREMLFADTHLLWVPTSPHVPNAETPFYMATTGLFGELGTLSEGVGTPRPFEICGAPWVNGKKFAEEMNSYKLPGVFFRPVYFKSYYLRFLDETCQGVQIHIIDFAEVQPLAMAVHLMSALRKLFPDYDFFEESKRRESFDRAAGTDKLMKDIRSGKPAEEIIASWQDALDEFKELRARYLIYP